MKVGSLFSGYGGLDMAVGGDLAWYAEIEPAACKVMEAHHPGVPNLGDVTQVDWSAVEPVDVITGGYPCQPFSNAGMRKGTNDERHLWPYVKRAISAIRPRYAVLENVRGHLTLGFDVVLADLADLGISARWGVVRAADAGAPHNRARLFIVAYPNGEGLQRRKFSTSVVGAEGLRQRTANSDCAHRVANSEGSEWGSTQSDDLYARRAAELGERAGATANPSSERHGSGQRSSSLELVGSSPKGSRWQASTTRQGPGAGSTENAWNSNGINDTSKQAWHSQGAEPEGNRSNGGQGNTDWGQYQPAIQRWGAVIGRSAPAPTIQRADRDRLNPAFVEWMMGLPEGWVTGHGLSASQELKMLGNGVVPQQARLALELLGGVA